MSSQNDGSTPIQSDSKYYCVVKFMSTGNLKEVSFSAVPKNWLTKNNSECFWPPSYCKNIRKLMKTCNNPDSTWTSYPVTILKEYDNYPDALKKEKKLINCSSSATEITDIEDQGRGKRKILLQNSDSDTLTEDEGEGPIYKKNKAKYFKINRANYKQKTWDKLVKKFMDPNDPDTYLSHFSDSSDNSAESIPKMPSPKNHDDSGTNTNFTNKSGATKQVEVSENTDITSPIIAQTSTPLMSPSTRIILSPSRSNSRSTRSVPGETSTPLMSPNTRTIPSPSTSSRSMPGQISTPLMSPRTSTIPSPSTSNQSMPENVLDILLANILKIRNTVSRIEQKVFSSDFNSNDTPVEYDHIQNLPLQSIEEILSFEKFISEDEQACAHLKQILILIGGTNIKNNVQRVLIKLFTNHVATKCSLTGAKNNFPLRNLRILTIMKEAVQKNFPKMKDIEFEETLRGWFRHASQRYIRESNGKK